MAESMQGLKRTHRCGELSAANVGETATIMGWVQKNRNKGGLVFVDVRDRSGIIQVVFDEGSVDAALIEKAAKLRSEYVVAVVGKVAKRSGAVNENIATGEIEIIPEELRVLSESETPPFQIEENSKTKEEVRLKYRYLDLRRPDMQRNLMMRSKVATLARQFMANEGFLEIETPVLIGSTPEGARDYLVPSRVHQGHFYALPQSPQLFKQLLMCSGYDRYFQIAKCFRDEDLRADRQPEFTQMDMELSFVDVDDVIDVNERFLAMLFKEVLGVEVPLPIPRMTWQEAMDRYGSDKPDTRFGMELVNVTDVVKDSEFVVFKGAIENGGTVRGINAKGQGGMARKKIDKLVDYAKDYGAKGLAYIAIHEDGTVKSSFAKFMTEDEQKNLIQAMDGENGDLLLFAADKNKVVWDVLGALRLELARQMELLDKNEYNMDILSGRAFVEVSIIEGLKATANWGMDLDNTRYTELINPYYGQYAGNTGGVVGVSHSRVFSINQQYLLTYKKNFGDHNIDLLAGFESYDYKNQALSGSKQKVYNPNIVELNNAINTPSANSSTANYATAGFLFRAQYDYLEKYFASASFRRDASSRFHPDNRWGNFWSVGLGWLMNKESFLQNTSWIDMLKFKISYGAQGNDNIGNYYAYLDQYTVSNSNNDFALALSYKGNKDITWETSHSFNTGFDFEFFKGRLSGTVEYFSRKTTDMLYNKPMNASAGYASIPMNVGSMTNKGVELDLNGLLIETNDLTWRMNFNLTHFKNTINELDPSLNGEMISGSYIYREGESRYQFYLRKYAGVDENGVAQYYKDITDAEGNVTGQEKTTDAPNATRYATGDILPKVYGGFGTSLNAYGFDFSISFAYQLGGRMYDNGYASLMNSGTDPGQNWHKDILKAWTADNKGSNIPRLSATDQYANYLSDRFLTKSDYLSINSITLGYTLPKSWVRSLNISSLRVYMSADNVALFSKRKGFDPRQSYTTASADVYSPIRAISGGLSLSF